MGGGITSVLGCMNKIVLAVDLSFTHDRDIIIVLVDYNKGALSTTIITTIKTAPNGALDRLRIKQVW